MKKISALILTIIAALCVCLAGCGDNTKKKNDHKLVEAYQLGAEVVDTTVAEAVKGVKIGLICLHDESSTYDKNFIDAMYRALETLNIPTANLELFTGIGEDDTCYQKANELAKTCDVIFADSFGHEDFMIQAAEENPDVYFCHATGTKAHTQGLSNYANAFASIYEGRYLAGIVAGYKLNQMIADGKITAEQAKMGYVGAFSYAEVISGFTSFYLGAKSVCPSVTMDVRFTGSWYDQDKEQEAANALIKGGCVLISQHADSYGAPNACETANVPNVTYNGSTETQCPNTYLAYSKIDWTPYFIYMIQQIAKKEAIALDTVGTLTSKSVIVEVSDNAPAGAKEAVEAAKAKLVKGELEVFNCDNFTVKGEKVASYEADVDTDADFTPDSEVVIKGAFEESLYRSAPYFDVKIDGITWLNEAF